MRRALRLAAKGGRAVAPNPMVGAVLVKNGRVIGQGYHQRFGGPHAEVSAIKSVRNSADLAGATLYVTLEPCRHWGKTPPCAELIAEVGIGRVVVGSVDPFQRKFGARNPKFEILNSKSLQREYLELNKFFFTWVTKKRPFITVKVAMSADGFVAEEDGHSVHLTTPAQDKKVHELRARHQAIMVGINTVLSDDPRLTVRGVPGADPLRVILDSHLRIPRAARVLADANHLVATTQKRGFAGVNVWQSPTRRHVSLHRLFRHLALQGIASVLVEPGPTLYRAFKRAKLIDELIVFRGKRRLKKGLKFMS